MKPDLKYLVVTPSLREFPYEYFAPLQEKVDHLIVDDSNGKVDRSGYADRTIIATDTFIKRYLGTNKRPALIPSGNPSCKNFGLLYAWREKYDVVILLDDDVDLRVDGQNFADSIRIDEKVDARQFSNASGWYNPLCQLLGEASNVFARGYPYEYRDEAIEFSSKVTVTPSFNEGLWLRVPDINGIDKVAMAPNYIANIGTKGLNDVGKPWFIEENMQPIPTRVVLRECQYLPLSIMNVQLARKLIPAFWQPPDYELGNGFRIRRHDDIWSMAFLKAAMDYFKDVATVGVPLVKHMKYGNPITEATNEHATNLIQYWVLETIRKAANSIKKGHTNYSEYAQELAERMLYYRCEIWVPGQFGAIIDRYANAAKAWAKLFG